MKRILLKIMLRHFMKVWNFELPSQLMTQRDELELAGLTEKAEEIDQVWNGLIQILDDLVTVFDDQEMTLQQFLDVLI